MNYLFFIDQFFCQSIVIINLMCIKLELTYIYVFDFYKNDEISGWGWGWAGGGCRGLHLRKGKSKRISC